LTSLWWQLAARPLKDLIPGRERERADGATDVHYVGAAGHHAAG